MKTVLAFFAIFSSAGCLFFFGELAPEHAKSEYRNRVCMEHAVCAIIAYDYHLREQEKCKAKKVSNPDDKCRSDDPNVFSDGLFGFPCTYRFAFLGARFCDQNMPGTENPGLDFSLQYILY